MFSAASSTSRVRSVNKTLAAGRGNPLPECAAPSPRIAVRWLAECLRVDDSTGFLFWLPRPLHHFSSEKYMRDFNAKFAGRRADEATYPGSHYRRVRVTHQGKKVAMSAHRVVFALKRGAWPAREVDHIDGDPTNNRPDNLRDVDHLTNVRSYLAIRRDRRSI